MIVSVSWVCVLVYWFGCTVSPIYGSPEKLDNVTYTVMTKENVTWVEAMTKCRDEQMELASVRNDYEQDDLSAQIIRAGLIKDVFWLGGMNFRDPNKFEWLTSERRPFVAVKFTHWQMNEPSNGGETNKNSNEHCIQLVGPGMLWRDYDCEEKAFFICENRL